MDRRTYLALAGTAFSSGLAGCGGGSDDGSEPGGEDTSGDPATDTGTTGSGDEPAGSTETRSEEDGSAETAAGPPELQSITATDDYYDPDNQTFSGSGDRDIGPFSHDGGLLVEDYSYEGSGTFTVEFQSDGSEYTRRGIPGYEPGGVSVDLLPEGQYELGVTADAPWELTLAGPEAPPSATVAPPATAGGSGFDLVGPMTDTASVSVVVNRDSTGPFQVTLIPEDVISGPDPLLLANTTEAVSDERFEPPVAWEYDGVVWAWVTTNAGWDIRFE